MNANNKSNPLETTMQEEPQRHMETLCKITAIQKEEKRQRTRTQTDLRSTKLLPQR